MNTLESILKELISARVEQLAHEAEQHPDCIKAKEQMLPLRTKAEQLMGEDDAEELVSMARGCDIPIYEHCYLIGARTIVQNSKMSLAHSEPRTFCYPSNPSSSQERVNPNPFFKKKKFGLYWFGGAKGIRTPDLYNANVARYQLCYSPKYSRRILCRFTINCF